MYPELGISDMDTSGSSWPSCLSSSPLCYPQASDTMVCVFTVAYPKETRRILTESNERKLPQRKEKRLTVMLDFGPPLPSAHIAVT